jgi:hypothetical protein
MKFPTFKQISILNEKKQRPKKYFFRSAEEPRMRKKREEKNNERKAFSFVSFANFLANPNKKWHKYTLFFRTLQRCKTIVRNFYKSNIQNR